MRKKLDRAAGLGQMCGTPSVIQACRRAKRSFVIVAAASVVGFGTKYGFAQTIYTWTGSTSTTFGTAANWSPNTSYPGNSTNTSPTTDIAEFSSSTTITNQPTLTGSAAFGGIWDTGNGTGTTSYEISFNAKHMTLDGTTINGNSGLGIDVDSGNSLIFDGTGSTSSNQYLTTGAAQEWLVNGTLTLQNFTGSSLDLTLPYALTIEGSGTTQIENKWNGAGALTIDGTGVVSFVGSGTSDTYTGQLTIQSGTLAVNAVNSQSANGQLGSSSDTNSIIMGGSGTTGTLDYVGTGSVGTSRSFNLAAGGTGNFEVAAGATLSVGTLASGPGAITGSGSLSVSGGGNLVLSGADTYSGGTSVTSGTLTIGATGSITSTAVNVSNGATMTVNGSIGTTTNLTNNGTFSSTLATTEISTLNGSGTVNLTSSTLSTLRVDAGGSFSGSIASSTGALLVTGGTLTLSGSNSYGSGTSVTGGTLVIDPVGPTASALPAGALNVSGSGEVQLSQNVTLGSQSTMGVPTSNVNISSLSISGNGVLDITNNHIIIDYTPGNDPINSIASMIATGYAGSTWSGPGIISSLAASNPSYGVGYADSADNGNPAGLASGTIEIMYTLLGDANLDGKVNGSDFTLMAANFNDSVTNGWDEGDFNYSGTVNGDDFVLLADNFNQFASQSAVAAADLQALDSFSAANGISLTSVPEPATVGLLTIGAIGVLSRRRRRN